MTYNEEIIFLEDIKKYVENLVDNWDIFTDKQKKEFVEETLKRLRKYW